MTYTINTDLLIQTLTDNLSRSGNPEKVDFVLRVLGHDNLAWKVSHAMTVFQSREADLEREDAEAGIDHMAMFFKGEKAEEAQLSRLVDGAREEMFAAFREVNGALGLGRD